jgi:hypothetical protein
MTKGPPVNSRTRTAPSPGDPTPGPLEVFDAVHLRTTGSGGPSERIVLHHGVQLCPMSDGRGRPRPGGRPSRGRTLAHHGVRRGSVERKQVGVGGQTPPCSSHAACATPSSPPRRRPTPPSPISTTRTIGSAGLTGYEACGGPSQR